MVTPLPKVPDWAAANASLMLKLPTFTHNSRMPTSSPTSPIRVTTKAFLAASRGPGFSNQNPINRYEHRPTSSQAIYNSRKLSASTNVSIAATKSACHAKYQPNLASPFM